MSHQENWEVLVSLPSFFDSPLNILQLLFPARLRILLSRSVVFVENGLTKATLIKREQCNTALGKQGVDMGKPRYVFIEAMNEYQHGSCGGLRSVLSSVEYGPLGTWEVRLCKGGRGHCQS